jgi:fumarate reductase flavoprotein subunit
MRFCAEHGYGTEEKLFYSRTKSTEEEMREKQNKVSRREFLQKGVAVGIGMTSVGALAACSQQSQEGGSAGEESSAVSWDHSADVVVVGSASGLLAAVEAADAGASVILIEKAPVLGGSMAINAGWYNGAGTAAQKRAGITDSAEAYWEQWQKVHAMYSDIVPLLNLDLIKLWIDNSGPTIDRLEELGMEFIVIQEPIIQEVPRGHILQPNVSAYLGILEPAALERGVEIMTNTRGTELIQQDDKTILGIKATNSAGETITIKANKAVILATGDTSGNTAILKKNYAPALATIPACWPHNTADGFLMAQAIGADSSENSLILVPMLWDPMSSYANNVIVAKGMIYVDKTAKRFCNEISGSAAAVLNANDDQTCYTIFSQDVADFARRPASTDLIAEEFIAGKTTRISLLPGSGFSYIDDYTEGDLPIVQADTIEDLATQLSLDPATLKTTVEEWNAIVAAEKDPDFGRPLGITGIPGVNAQFGPTVAMLTPPFYALQTNGVGIQVIEGPNLIVDKDMAVLDVYGNQIPKLFACGAGLAGGVPILHVQHGEHTAFSLVSALIAAQSSVSELSGK